MNVASDCSNAARNCTPSAATRRLTTITRAPTTNGRTSSSTEMSNERVVTASSESSVVNPGRRAIEQRKLTTPR